MCVCITTVNLLVTLDLVTLNCKMSLNVMIVHTMTIVKSCWHNFTQSAYFKCFFVSSISYRPTDLSLLKEFSKKISFEDFQKKI